MASDPLGDGISKIELLKWMGDDLDVVNAARVSFDAESWWEKQWPNHPEQNELTEKDKKLIHYLAQHHHWTPFAHPQFKFRIKMPIFVAREWYRHTIGLTRNEVSGRYVKANKQFFIPKELRQQSATAKQGSDGVFDDRGIQFTLRMSVLTNEALALYKEMIEAGVAAEQARTILPQSMYTEFIETGSLAAYARICALRISPDAQQECRVYAEAVSNLIQPIVPVSWEALNGL